MSGDNQLANGYLPHTGLEKYRAQTLQGGESPQDAAFLARMWALDIAPLVCGKIEVMTGKAVTPDSVWGRSHKFHFMLARKMISYVLRNHPQFLCSASAIGSAMGRDHTSVLSQLSGYQARLERQSYAQDRAAVSWLCAELTKLGYFPARLQDLMTNAKSSRRYLVSITERFTDEQLLQILELREHFRKSPATIARRFNTSAGVIKRCLREINNDTDASERRPC